MRTTRHPMRSVLPLAGVGLMLAGLFGGPALPAASAAEIEPFAYRYDWSAQNPYGYGHPWGPPDDWGPRDRWGDRHDRSSRRWGYGLPDRYTIHKGKKCELQCERIRGTREYRCREYRC